MHVEAPRRRCMSGPWRRAKVWKHLGMTEEPMRWRWPMMGREGGLGGGPCLVLFLAVIVVRDLTRKLKKTSKAKEEKMV